MQQQRQQQPVNTSSEASSSTSSSSLPQSQQQQQQQPVASSSEASSSASSSSSSLQQPQQHQQQQPKRKVVEIMNQQISSSDGTAAHQPLTKVSKKSSLYGLRRLREDYSEDELKTGSLLSSCLKRAYNDWRRESDAKQTSDGKKKRGDDYQNLRLTCVQMLTREFNYPCYRESFISLLHFHSIESAVLDFTPADFSKAQSRLRVIDTFANILFDNCMSDALTNGVSNHL